MHEGVDDEFVVWEEADGLVEGDEALEFEEVEVVVGLFVVAEDVYLLDDGLEVGAEGEYGRACFVFIHHFC